jgi:CRP/FNR family transcriptional regulator, cyclic AMP receptor protein
MDEKRLKRFALFSELPEEQLTKLAGTVNEWSKEAGETLIKAGGSSEQLFAIEEGKVDVCDHGEPVATVGEGEVVGEMGVLKRGLRKATVEVAEDAKGFFLISQQVEMLRREADGFEEKLEKLTEERGH